jgi:hypothetical protein
MIRLDVYSKVILTVIAVVLAILLVRGGGDWGVAQAQAQNVKAPPQVAVNLIKEISVTGFKEVILLGDQKTFLIRVEKGIGVYQVQEY